MSYKKELLGAYGYRDEGLGFRLGEELGVQIGAVLRPAL